MKEIFCLCWTAGLLINVSIPVAEPDQNRPIAIVSHRVFETGPIIPQSRKVQIQTRLSQDKVHPGSTCFAALLLNIEQGWHINSASPSDENMIATTVESKGIKGIDVPDVRYPTGVTRKLEFSDKLLEVYEGSVPVFLKLRIAPSLQPGEYTLPVDVTYQACNDDLCLAPAVIHVLIPVRVAAPSDSVSFVNSDLFRRMP